jgi:hypothetical protein
LEKTAFWRKQVKTRQATSIVVLVSCLIVSSASGLFHSDECFLGALNKGKTNSSSSSEHCPACIFTAGFKSIEADYGLPLLGVTSPIACETIPRFTVVNHHQWSYSILLRAPPSTSAF